MRFGFVKKRERIIEQHFEKNEQKSEIWKEKTAVEGGEIHSENIQRCIWNDNNIITPFKQATQPSVNRFRNSVWSAY